MKTRFYGDGGTIHDTIGLDIEMKDGVVVSVWFRCQPLPFKVTEVREYRANEMQSMYREGHMPEIHGLQLKDEQ